MMPSSRSVLAVTVALALSVVGVVPTGAGGPFSSPGTLDARQLETQKIDSCTVITESGRYVLADDVLNGGAPTSAACIRIEADDVVFDGRGRVVNGRGVTDTTGVLVVATSNVTIRNVEVTDWNRGVFVRNASDVTVRNVYASNDAVGIEVRAASARLVGNTATDDLRGVVLADPGNDTLRGTTFRANHVLGLYAPLPVAFAGFERSVGPPLDPDGDGKYEDVTGDGEVGVRDAATFPAVAAAHVLGVADAPADQRATLDFDDDGGVDFSDVFSYAGLESPA